MRIELDEISYSVIYWVDIYCYDEEAAKPGKERPISIKRYFPPKEIIAKMRRTEDTTNHMEGEEVVAHGKWCGVLDYGEFDMLLSGQAMDVEKCSTMGSLGAPGFDFGWAPAVPFRGAEDYYLPREWAADVGAYVTPLITAEQAAAWGLVDESAWDFIEKEMWNYRW